MYGIRYIGGVEIRSCMWRTQGRKGIIGLDTLGLVLTWHALWVWVFAFCLRD